MNKVSLQERKDLYELINAIRTRKTRNLFFMLNDKPSDYTSDVIDIIKQNSEPKATEMHAQVNQALKEFEVHQLRTKHLIATMDKQLDIEGNEILSIMASRRNLQRLYRESKLKWIINNYITKPNTTFKKAEIPTSVHLNTNINNQNVEKLLCILFYCESELTRYSRKPVGNMSARDLLMHNNHCIGISDAIVDISQTIDEYRNKTATALKRISKKKKALEKFNKMLKGGLNDSEYGELFHELFIFNCEESKNVITIDD